MKKLSILFMSLVAMSTAFTSCSDDDNNAAPATTDLELKITDIVTDEVVSGATVVLYNSAADLQGNKNPIGTAQTSDANGKVTFKNLEAKVYYFRAAKAEGCLDNLYTAFFTYNPSTGQQTPLVAGKVNAMDVPVIGMGDISFKNTTADSYNVYIRQNAGSGEPFEYDKLDVLAPNATESIKVPAVGWDVKYVRLIGDLEDPTGTVEKLNNVVTACGNKEVTTAAN